MIHKAYANTLKNNVLTKHILIIYENCDTQKSSFSNEKKIHFCIETLYNDVIKYCWLVIP